METIIEKFLEIAIILVAAKFGAELTETWVTLGQEGLSRKDGVVS